MPTHYTAKLLFHHLPELDSDSVIVTVVNCRQHCDYTVDQLCSHCAAGINNSIDIVFATLLGDKLEIRRRCRESAKVPKIQVLRADFAMHDKCRTLGSCH